MQTVQEQLAVVAKLNEPTKKMLSFIEAYWVQFGHSPTYRVMIEALDSDFGSITRRLKQLEDLNLLKIQRFGKSHAAYIPNLPGRVYGAEVA